MSMKQADHGDTEARRSSLSIAHCSMLIAQCCLQFLLAWSATAATYYVDFDGGSDANNGTSTATPWLNIPGTRNVGDTADVATTFGSFTTSAKIPDNTTIKIKSGTTHDSTDGGYVWIRAGSSGYYNLGCTNLLIQKDSSWGSGDVTMDATGMTVGIGLMLVQIDGVTFDGLKLQDSPLSGFYFKEKAGDSAPLTNVFVLNCTTSNHGTSIASDPAGAAEAHVNFRRCQNAGVSNCVMNGNQQFINGVLFGDNDKAAQNIFIGSCTITNLKGDITDNDTGIAGKILNATGVVTNSLLQNNLKGLDIGEQAAETAMFDGSNASMGVKVYNNNILNNYWGVGVNAMGADLPASYTLTPKHYIFNNLIASNGVVGVNAYAGPFELSIVHNVFRDNGFATNTGAAPLYNQAHVRITPDVLLDTNRIVGRAYNNTFQGQLALGGNSNTVVFLNSYIANTNDFTLDFDWNYYVQSGSNTRFAMIGALGGPTAEFAFGVNGPGHASGTWWAWYSTSTTPLTHAGTGHFHADAGSRGTGSDNTTVPPFNTADVPTNSYAGTNLTAKSWYITEMGRDRNGNVRSEYTLGAYEYMPVGTSTVSRNGQGTARDFRPRQ